MSVLRSESCGTGYPQTAENQRTKKRLIAAGMHAAIGVKSDGTVMLKKRTQYGFNLRKREWNKIIAVAASKGYLVGLKSDGTVTDTMEIRTLFPGGHTRNLPPEFINSILECNKERKNWRNIVAIAMVSIKESGFFDFLLAGLKSDGTVVAADMFGSGKLRDNTIVQEMSEWRDVAAVAAGDYVREYSPGYKNVEAYGVGLKMDGTVIVTSNYCRDNYQKTDIENGLSGWQDIVDVAAGNGMIAGVKSDGTVAVIVNSCRGEVKEKTSCWKDIVAVACNGVDGDGTFGHPYSDDDKHIAGLKSDGTVVSTEYGELGWKDIIAIAYNTNVLVGLRADGSVVQATKENPCEILDWKLFGK